VICRLAASVAYAGAWFPVCREGFRSAAVMVGISRGSLDGDGNGLGEIGIGEWAEPNIVLDVGTGSGVAGDGGTFGLESGEGHRVTDVAEEAELIDWPSHRVF
jgi:hypothetical protein